MNVRTSLLFCVLLAVLHVVPSSSQNFFNPSIALSSDARCAVACNAAASDGGKVFLSLIGPENQVPGTPVFVNEGLKGYGQNPAVACGLNNRVSLVWEQWNGGGISSIYRVNCGANGTPLTVVPEMVLDNPSINAQTPKIAVGTDGREIVVWLDYRLGRPAIYAQRYTKEGRKSGKNIRIADAGSIIQTPAVCVTARNEVGFIWQETIRDSFRVVFSRSGWNLKKFARVVIDNSRGQAYSSTPDIAATSDGGYAAVWKDYRTGESNIYLQRISRQGIPQGLNTRINDDTTRNWQRLPRITASPTGMVVVWEDYRNDRNDQIGDIYAQRLDRRGYPLGENFKVNDAPEPAVQRAPAAWLNARGEAAIVWSDSRSGMAEVYMRRLNASAGAVFGKEIRIVPSH